MTIKARYPGECSKCGGPVAVGQQIEWEKGKGARHTDCPVVERPRISSGMYRNPRDAEALRSLAAYAGQCKAQAEADGTVRTAKPHIGLNLRMTPDGPIIS